jgi:hypothetical protein
MASGRAVACVMPAAVRTAAPVLACLVVAAGCGGKRTAGEGGADDAGAADRGPPRAAPGDPLLEHRRVPGQVECATTSRRPVRKKTRTSVYHRRAVRRKPRAVLSPRGPVDLRPGCAQTRRSAEMSAR